MELDFYNFGNSNIRNFSLILRVNKNIGWFKCRVQYFIFIKVDKSFKNIFHDFKVKVSISIKVFFNILPKVTVHKFHDNMSPKTPWIWNIKGKSVNIKNIFVSDRPDNIIDMKEKVFKIFDIVGSLF